MTNAKKKKARSGFSPTPEELHERREAGYFTPATLAKQHGVSLSSVYSWGGTWARDGVKVDGKPAAYKHKSHLWILGAAVAAKVAIPAGAA